MSVILGLLQSNFDRWAGRCPNRRFIMKKKPDRTLISSLLKIILCIAALALIATLPGGGWYFGAQVQNVSSYYANVTFTVYDFASGAYPRSDGISSGAYRNYGPADFSLFFVGTLTQRMRCGDTCGWGNNYPWEGFQLLSRALASNVTTRQAMRWSTDIEFQPNQP
jgi:hypothetical protein